MQNVSHVSACYYHRYGRGRGRGRGRTEAEYCRALLDELEREFERVGAGRVAAFVLEPVVGATTGCVRAVPGYVAGGSSGGLSFIREGKREEEEEEEGKKEEEEEEQVCTAASWCRSAARRATRVPGLRRGVGCAALHGGPGRESTRWCRSWRAPMREREHEQEQRRL